MIKRLGFIVLVAGVLLGALTVWAGDRVISINDSSANQTWFITGEKSLVMNGFDLGAQGVALPAIIDRVSIGVDTPVPGQPIDVIIYQDANGGSPVDATVAGRATVDITQAGTFTATFSPAVTVTSPAVWIGFYLPVNFRFIGDSSGSSVLTYWAWTPNGTFDVASLSSAAVFGPADGSAPVSINMRGRARITAEITGAAGGTVPVAAGTPVAPTTGTGGNLAVMVNYPTCTDLSYDSDDEFTSLRNRFDFVCSEVPTWQAPIAPAGYVRQGRLYDVTIFQEGGYTVTGRLSATVTHCIRPEAAVISSSVIGVAYGSPRQWRILPTQRFGDRVCAEVRFGGNVSLFTVGTLISPTATTTP